MVPIDSGPMDLTEDVRQSIGLAQPMKIFCKPDCKGLCSVCHKNRNLADCGHAQGGECHQHASLVMRPLQTLIEVQSHRHDERVLRHSVIGIEPGHTVDHAHALIKTLWEAMAAASDGYLSGPNGHV